MTAQRRRIPIEGSKSWLVAGLLSLLIPGLGDLYNGRIGRGIATFVFCLVLVALFLPLAVILWPAAALQSALMAAGIGRCPFCRANIDRKALRCRHCGSDLFEDAAPADGTG
jgi:TM2 domain-containing membrane protein YozV